MPFFTKFSNKEGRKEGPTFLMPLPSLTKSIYLKLATLAPPKLLNHFFPIKDDSQLCDASDFTLSLLIPPDCLSSRKPDLVAKTVRDCWFRGLPLCSCICVFPPKLVFKSSHELKIFHWNISYIALYISCGTTSRSS